MFKIDRLQSDLINNYQKVQRRVQDYFHQGLDWINEGVYRWQKGKNKREGGQKTLSYLKKYLILASENFFSSKAETYHLEFH